MALDAATLALTAAELKATLTDAKIAKIFEPTRDELVITLRTRTDTYALLLSARSGSARVCLTEETFENPETPPSFCMLMRKHLTGGRLLDVHMEPGDRIVYFDFQCTNEMGDLVRNTLCAELMGRYSNLVLVQSGKIIDALKRVDFEDSDVRQLLPGLPYTTPPKPARPDFLLVSSASIVAAACERDLPVADALNKTVAGVGPVVCREAAWRAFDGEHLPANELTEEQKRKLMAAIDELKEEHATGGTPCSVTDPSGKPIEYTFFRPQQYGEKYIIKEWPSFNAMLEGYYAEKDRAERLRTKSKELHKAVHNMYERAVRKQAARQEELAASGKSEKLRLYGELLSANLYLAQKGMKSITVPNWYDEGKEVTIPLDLRFSPSQNAQNFFKNYKKKQTAGQMLKKLLLEGDENVAQVARADARRLQFVNDSEQAFQLPGRRFKPHREGDVVGHGLQVAAQVAVLVDAADQVDRQPHVALRKIAVAQLLDEVFLQRPSFGQIDRTLLVVLRKVVDAALVRRRVVLPEVFVEGDLLGRLLLVLGRTLLLFQHDIVFDLLFDALFELHGGQFQQLDHLYLLRRELLLKRKYLFLINSHIGSKLRIVQHSEFGLFIYRVLGFSKVVQGGRIPVFGKSGAAGAHSSMWLSRTAREGRKAPHSDGFR